MHLVANLIDACRRAWRCRKPLRRPEYDRAYRMSLREWLLYHQREIVYDKATWMGIPIWKNPLDAWIYQEIIYEVRPEVIVEIGSARGGSTRFFADLLEIMGAGQVVSIDKDRSQYHLTHSRVTALTGLKESPEIIAATEALCRGKRTLVIQDGGHRKEQALADLTHYAPLVSVGSYFIMEDGIVDLFPPGDGLVGLDTPGPLAAVEAFLKDNTDFVVDHSRERYLLTYSPRGFLKRVA